MIRLFILLVLLLSVQKLNSQTVDPLISEDFLKRLCRVLGYGACRRFINRSSLKLSS